jgi:hypothetical protein
MLSYSANTTCSYKTQPVLTLRNTSAPVALVQKWTISFWEHEDNSETDKVYVS